MSLILFIVVVTLAIVLISGRSGDAANFLVLILLICLIWFVLRMLGLA